MPRTPHIHPEASASIDRLSLAVTEVREDAQAEQAINNYYACPPAPFSHED